MRVAIACSSVALVLVLGTLQVLGSVAVRESARAGAWVTFVPKGLARRVDDLDTALPLPEALRLVLARHAIARGDTDLAARDLARLKPSRDRLQLEGRLAQSRHDPSAAVAAFLAAGDLSDVQAAVDAEAANGNFERALALEQAAIVRLGGDRTQADALAEAYLHLGLLDQSYAYRFPAGSPKHRTYELSAVAADERAATLSPLSLRYLIVLGNEQLNLGRLEAAKRTFARARDIDPTSAEPLAGLADAALRAGDRATARAYLKLARALDPASSAVLRLAPRLDM